METNKLITYSSQIQKFFWNLLSSVIWQYGGYRDEQDLWNHWKTLASEWFYCALCVVVLSYGKQGCFRGDLY